MCFIDSHFPLIAYSPAMQNNVKGGTVYKRLALVAQPNSRIHYNIIICLHHCIICSLAHFY